MRIISFNPVELLKRGVDTLANAVKVTLGPEGKTVILSTKNGRKITKDGVSVAKEIFLEDPIANEAAQIVKEVASKTADVAGDGTTTATVLVQSLIKDLIDEDLHSSFFKDLNEEKEKVIEFLKSKARKVSASDIKTLEQVATISANNDETLGKIVAEAVHVTGEYGIVTAEEGDSFETKISLTQGMNFDNGYVSSLFITDQEKLICEMEDVMIFMYDSELSTIKDILPILRSAAARKKSLLVIANEITGEAISTLLAQKQIGFKCAAVKCPSFGDYKKSLMVDIATVTGGVYLDSQKGMKFEDLTDVHFGFAERVVITKDETTIIKGDGNEEKISLRIKQLENQIENTQNEYEVNFMKKRIAKMKGGVAVIEVGGFSEVEIKEKKDRIEDAIYAVRAALEEGVVEGGGIAYLRATEVCKNKALKNALVSPFEQICLNADIKPLTEEIKNNKILGINIKTMEEVDMFEAGIVDPLKVTRTALENAVSVATTFLTTKCIIVEK